MLLTGIHLMRTGEVEANLVRLNEVAKLPYTSGSGYQAVLELGAFGYRTTVLVRIALDSQSEDALRSFEAGVAACPGPDA